MWKLKHWLFGWDYVKIRYAFDYHVRRIRTSYNGVHYCNWWGDILYLTDNFRDKIWLTCNPDKYIKE